MVPPTPTPSPRLRKAAEAERQQLAQHRRELLAARESLRAELERIEGSLQTVSERETLLDRLIGRPNEHAVEPTATRLARQAADEDATDRTAVVLRGPAIRHEAVRALLAHPDRPEALHYRDWFELLREAGFTVGGKDPLATFLTQLSRSPAVRKSTQAGVYELDSSASARLRRRVDELHTELRAVTATAGQGPQIAAIRARRSELNAELSRAEKALEEVEFLFMHAHEELTPLAARG